MQTKKRGFGAGMFETLHVKGPTSLGNKFRTDMFPGVNLDKGNSAERGLKPTCAGFPRHVDHVEIHSMAVVKFKLAHCNMHA